MPVKRGAGLQKMTGAAAKGMRLVQQEVRHGSLQGEAIGSLLTELDDSIEAFSGRMQNIANATEQQAAAMAGLVRNVEVVNSISASTSTGLDSTRQAMLELADRARRLHETVAEFRFSPG